MLNSTTSSVQQGVTKLDQYRQGYPRYTALLSTHQSFYIFRRFTRVRMRLLLLKQDEISNLEESLDSIDAKENCELFLGCSRRDRNEERREILQKLSVAMSEYDTMLEENYRSLNLPNANNRDIQNLKNWTQGTSSLSRKETAYLDHHYDLLNLSSGQDHAMTRIETLVEDSAIFLNRIFGRCLHALSKKRSKIKTADELVFFLGPRLRKISRAITTWLAALVLLIPVVILYNISSSVVRLVVIVISAGFFLSALSLFTEARTVEVFAAGASYAAVLVVFTSAGNGSQLNGNFTGNCPTQCSSI